MSANTLKTNDGIRMQAEQLQDILANTDFVPPIFARLRLKSGTTLVPVQSVGLGDDGLTILCGEDGHTETLFFGWGGLMWIEVFFDKKRKPVFLHNFDEKGDFGEKEETLEDSRSAEERNELRAVLESFS